LGLTLAEGMISPGLTLATGSDSCFPILTI